MKNLLKIMTGLALVSALLCSCKKEVLETQGKSLGVKELYPSAGSFSMYIRTSGVWSVSSPESWIHVPSGFFKDNYGVEVKYDSNESHAGLHRFNRLGHVIIKTYDGATADTLYVRQKGIEPFIAFDEENIIPSSGGACSIPVHTNLGGEQRGSIVCISSEGWISSPVFGRDCASVEFDAASGASRRASITLAFTDAWGIVTEASCIIKQQ